MIGSLARTATRWTVWGRAIAIGELALLAKRHLEHLEPGEGTELRRLLTKSKGRPGNLTAKERSRLMELAKKLEPGAFAKTAATNVTPLRKKR